VLAPHLESIERYQQHLYSTSAWCTRAVKDDALGARAHFSPFLGWSKPCPAVSAKLIPTLLRLSAHLDDPSYRQTAHALGQWLLDTQQADGSWDAKAGAKRQLMGRVFSTGQAVKGMMALYRDNQALQWLEAGGRGSSWLAASINAAGQWSQAGYTPRHKSYCTHVAWPLLECWQLTQDPSLKSAAERLLDNALSRVKNNGVIADWGFKESSIAYTHTIGLAIRDFQEASRLIDDYDRYAAPMEPALEVIYRKTSLGDGRLQGLFDENWYAAGDFVCLSGNAQLAICLLTMEKHRPDPRLVDAAAKLINYVLDTQKTDSRLTTRNGAVAGSHPFWGRYMSVRYPVSAAKYVCDALMVLQARLQEETTTAVKTS